MILSSIWNEKLYNANIRITLLNINTIHNNLDRWQLNSLIQKSCKLEYEILSNTSILNKNETYTVTINDMTAIAHAEFLIHGLSANVIFSVPIYKILLKYIRIHQKLEQSHNDYAVLVGIGCNIITDYHNLLKWVAYLFQRL